MRIFTPEMLWLTEEAKPMVSNYFEARRLASGGTLLARVTLVLTRAAGGVGSYEFSPYNGGITSALAHLEANCCSRESLACLFNEGGGSSRVT
ncbi:hypothetical protein TorRG33x02_331750 [Trema orientale]|uniref:Uncharacterized protein n=1 Tax=Trema orientale TaxID=63057 RepID=A0A2P5B5Q8_TREOI|nr:hypothetical protein TorRG33x02_331750 [Trema orientale]